MRRILVVQALLLFCVLPGRLASQQPYPRLARVVGAVRTAALVSTPAAAPRSTDRLDIGFALPPLANRPGTSRRQVFRVILSERLHVSATGDWISSGPAVTLGFGVRF